MTQEALAEKAGIAQAALSRDECGIREPDGSTTGRIADELSLQPWFLVRDFRLEGAVAADVHMRRQRTVKPADWKRAEARLSLRRVYTAILVDRMTMRPQNAAPSCDPNSTALIWGWGLSRAG